nr:unknown similar to AcMNPV orf145 [Darna trima granulovirus]
MRLIIVLFAIFTCIIYCNSGKDDIIKDKFVCPPGELINVPHPYLCDSFYMCLRDYYIQLFCEQGHEFSAHLNRCVPINESGCTANSII